MVSRYNYNGSLNLNYRYSFNGKENDGDVKGEGNQQDYGMRIYDPRLGRFLSVDPITKQYPELTPYQFASNRPIDGIDQDGLEYNPYGAYKFWKGFGNSALRGVKSTVQHIASNPNHAGYDIRPKPITQEQINRYNIDWSRLLDPNAQIDAFSQNLVYGTGNFVGGIIDGDGERTAKAIPPLLNSLGTIGVLKGFKGTVALSDELLAGSKELAAAEKFTLKSINSVKGTQNCVNCSIATDSYLKGAPASALNSGAKPLAVLEKEFGKKFTHNLSIQQVEKLVGENGQIGIVFGSNGSGKVGHVFNVINQKGTINFIDGQTGKAAKISGYQNFSFLPTN